jgi:hypothetical protein
MNTDPGLIDRAREDLQKLRVELEPSFKKIEAALDDAGKKLGNTAERVRLQAALAASEAKGSWPGLEAAVDHILTDIKGELKKSADAIDPDKAAAEVREKLFALKKRLFG